MAINALTFGLQSPNSPWGFLDISKNGYTVERDTYSLCHDVEYTNMAIN